MDKLKGITVELFEKAQTGTDAFGCPIYKESPIEVHNVLVAPVSSADAPEEVNVDGKKVIYTLAIPKGDTHKWEGRKVRFFGQTFETVGFSVQGIDEMIPLFWNKKIQVVAYD